MQETRDLPKSPQLTELGGAGWDDTSWRCHDVGMEGATVMREGFVMEEAPEPGLEGSE